MSTPKEKDEERAKDQARIQLESIVEKVKRLTHIEDCDGTDCELSDPEIYSGINLYWQEGKSDPATEEERAEYHDEEAARQSIQEDPLSVQVRGGWRDPGSENEDMEFMILLCTGGPAVRIVGELGAGDEPDSATVEYQDWFTPWVEYNSYDNRHELLTYCQQFYFGS